MIETTDKNPSATRPDTDQSDSWKALYERIRELALKKSAALLLEDESEEAADRGARSLRTLMGAAEIARRMKQQDEKETDLHDGAAQPPAYTDEDLRRIYRDVVARVERIEQEEAQTGSHASRARSDCDLSGTGETKNMDGKCS